MHSESNPELLPSTWCKVAPVGEDNLVCVEVRKNVSHLGEKIQVSLSLAIMAIK